MEDEFPTRKFVCLRLLTNRYQFSVAIQLIVSLGYVMIQNILCNNEKGFLAGHVFKYGFL